MTFTIIKADTGGWVGHSSVPCTASPGTCFFLADQTGRERGTGKYVGKDDPVMIGRCQSGLPAVGEALEPFAFPHTVAGCMEYTTMPAVAH